ncbi:hypothetical protein [Streptomyces sp. NBC_00576]|uniref:hypothetical protein n=1 Tax=Streptomyces sp. NBC_00576 TaxID=2903665 RepID=UPI002E82310C|nr:hypothetical protein [Streptomyces sp. NBC_00576]WUB77701.1 hypothetical protein OG734_47595 [Streptomyces sp. NBC_00576]
MRNPVRPLLIWWGQALGVVGIVEDVLTTVRDRRLTKADSERLPATARNTALAEARKGCTHSPTCPPAAAPDRTRAAEVWSDDACVYLCNGLVLATKAYKAPDSLSGLYTPMPKRETTP